MRSINYVSQIILPASVLLLFCQWEILKGALKKGEGEENFLSISSSCQHLVYTRVSFLGLQTLLALMEAAVL